MAAFEYIYLLNEFEVKLLMQYTILFSLVSALLASAYLVARSLTTRMLLILITLYTIAYTVTMLGIYTTAIDMARLTQAALDAEAAGEIMLPRINTISAEGRATYSTFAIGSLMVGSVMYVASLAFMFGIRRAEQPEADTRRTG